MTGPRIKAPSKAQLRHKESPIVTAILKALKMKGIFCWRVNAGLTVFKAQAGHARRVVKGAEAGTPDILLVLPTKTFGGYWVPASSELGAGPPLGALCGLEVKAETGKLSESQIAWHAKAEQHGVRVAVVRSVGEALAAVKNWSAT